MPTYSNGQHQSTGRTSLTWALITTWQQEPWDFTLADAVCAVEQRITERLEQRAGGA